MQSRAVILAKAVLKYTIPAEFDTALFHKRGALAAAREADEYNPKKSQQLHSILYCGRANFYGCRLNG